MVLLFTVYFCWRLNPDNNWTLIFMCKKNIITIVSRLLIVFFTNVNRLQFARGNKVAC